MRLDRLTPLLFVLLACGQAVGAPGSLRLRLEGIDGELERNVRAHLSLAQLKCDTPEWRVHANLELAGTQVARAARALGYYHTQIRERKAEHRDDCWAATLRIEAGPVTRLAGVDVAVTGPGKDDAAYRKLLTELPLHPGDVLHHDRYESLKKRLQDIAAERGYFGARFVRHTLRVDPAKNRAWVQLTFDTGPRYRVGVIHIHQQEFNDDIVRRHLHIHPGEPYDASRLAATQEALSGTALFREVSITPEIDQARDGRIPIDIRLTAAKRFLYKAGIGVSTDTGPHLRLGFENRRINRRGHRLAMELKLSRKESEFSTEYFIPLNWSHHHLFTLNGGLNHEETESTTSDRFSLGTHLVGRRGSFDETLSLSYSQERSDIGEDRVKSELLVAGGQWTRREVIGRTPFLFGHQYSFDLRGALKDLLSDASLLQGRVRGRWLQPLGRGRLLMRAELGLTLTDDFDALPASLRFFAGGDLSLRGYGYKALGPKDDAGHVVGGRNLLLMSAEYEHPLTPNWSLAGFVDAGNAFNDTRVPLKTGAGIGVRWYSPVGRFGLDLAFPSDTSEDDWRIHLTMGALL